MILFSIIMAVAADNIKMNNTCRRQSCF